MRHGGQAHGQAYPVGLLTTCTENLTLAHTNSLTSLPRIAGRLHDIKVQCHFRGRLIVGGGKDASGSLESSHTVVVQVYIHDLLETLETHNTTCCGLFRASDSSAPFTAFHCSLFLGLRR